MSQRIADFIEAPLSHETETAATRFLQRNPQHRHGRHHYALADFGLTADEVARRFAAYREHFGFRASV